jgi:hypothetical protein
MIEALHTGTPKLVGFRLTGTLHDSDYRSFVPALEAAIAAAGPIRLLAEFDDFHGWDLHAAWDDFKFGARHYADIERIALVGDRAWERWMAKLCKPFTRAQVRYFDAGGVEAAWAWLGEGM